jgi:uncharacterized integral membrane protein
MKLLFWIFVLLLAAALALFAASNREMVALAWWPLDYVLELPLYLAVIGAALIGLLLGSMAAWCGGRRWRRDARRRARRITALEHELAATQAQLPGAVAPRSMPADTALRRAG